MYLEERIDRLEAFMELLINEHPELCPHQFLGEEITKDEWGRQYQHIRCRFCGKQEVYEIDPRPVQNRVEDIGFHF